MKKSMGRRRHRRIGVLGAVAALSVYLVVAAVPASAAETCGVTGATPTQTLDGDSIGRGAEIGHHRGLNATQITVYRLRRCRTCKADVSAIVVNADTLAEVEHADRDTSTERR